MVPRGALLTALADQSCSISKELRPSGFALRSLRCPMLSCRSPLTGSSLTFPSKPRKLGAWLSCPYNIMSLPEHEACQGLSRRRTPLACLGTDVASLHITQCQLEVAGAGKGLILSLAFREEVRT
jgi:hypothetical protein